MSRALKCASAAAVAVAVETSSLLMLTHVVALDLSIAFAMAFAAGYLALFATTGVLRPFGARSPLRAQLRAYGLFGIAVLLIVEAMLYMCDDLLHVNLITTNAVVLVAVACWIALGWRFVGGDAHRPPSVPASASTTPCTVDSE